MLMAMLDQDNDKARNKGEIIHSGHFMISSVADQDEADEEVLHDRDSPIHHDQAIRLREGYDFSNVMMETQNTYQFGDRSTNQITIDGSLSRLFECMSLAYRGGKVVSPKWKSFKGMKLSVKDKIRLNNAIWRTWHIQYIMHRSKLSFVQFVTPLDGESDSHSKPESVVMEGKYWKRRIETVVEEYKRWRAFFMEKLRQSDRPGLTWVSNLSPPASNDNRNMSDMMKYNDDSLFMDGLLSCLSQPFPFPNPREIALHATNSDMMQPGLLQLQPSIDEFVDPIDSLHDIFNPTKKSSIVDNSNVGLSFSGTNFPTPHSSFFTNGMMTGQQSIGEQLNTPTLEESSLEELVQSATIEQDQNAMCISQPQMEHMQIPSAVTQQQDTRMPTFGVSDPMLNSIPPTITKSFTQISQQATSQPTLMLVSKQQQNTPTISQVVMSHTHHHTGYNSNSMQEPMPPPQKKPPRRKSASRQNPFSGSVGVITPSTPPVQQFTIQQTLGTHHPPGNFTTVQHTTPMPQVLYSTLLTPPMSTNSYRQAIITPGITSYAISSAALIPVDNLVYSQALTVNQGMVTDTISNTNNVLPSATNWRKDNNVHQSYIIPISVQQPLQEQHQGSSNEPSPAKVQIVVKESLNLIPHTPLIKLLSDQRAKVPQALNITVPSQVPLIQHDRNTSPNQTQTMKKYLSSSASRQFKPNSLEGMYSNGDKEQNISCSSPTLTGQTINPFIINVEDFHGNADKPFEIQKQDQAQENQSESIEDTTSLTPVSSPSASSTTSSINGEQRLGHFTAEQKRRCNIKMLFSRLQEILPGGSAKQNSKVSKAVLLNKATAHVKQLQNVRSQTNNEIQQIKKEIKQLNEDISNFQQQLPATGAPACQQQDDRMRHVFEEWIRDRILHDWKFFIFGMIIQPLFATYDQTVSVRSVEDLCKTCMTWLEKYCSLPSLRPSVVNSLQELSTTTSILSDPATLQQQAESAVQRRDRHPSNPS